MDKELVKIERPQLPEQWDYEESVKKGKQLFIRWKDITIEIAEHFYIAREMLRSKGGRPETSVKSRSFSKDWGDYCQEVSSIEDKKNARDAFNRMLARFWPPLEKPHVSQATGESEWNTPPEYIESARKLMGKIDLDPASNKQAQKNIKAEVYYTKEKNGLTKPWAGNVWMNPPYSQPLVKDFCNTLVKKYNAGEINQACVLINNATETEFFQNMLKVCTAVCFIKGRVKFIDKNGEATGTPLQGQVIIYFGNESKKFKDLFSKYGEILWKEGK